jgi:hypothetical protein
VGSRDSRRFRRAPCRPKEYKIVDPLAISKHHNALAIQRWVLNRFENFLLYSSLQWVTNQ